MKIVDLDTAQSLLHRSTRGPSLIQPPAVHKDTPPPPPPAAAHHGAGGGGTGGTPGFKPPEWDQFHGPPQAQGGRDERGRGGAQVPPPQGDYNRIRVSRNCQGGLNFLFFSFPSCTPSDLVSSLVGPLGLIEDPLHPRGVITAGN